MDVIKAIENYMYYHRITGKSIKEWQKWRIQAVAEWKLDKGILKKGVETVPDEKRFLNVGDVSDIMECSQGQAYKIIRQLNDELKEKGYITLSGKVNSKYFYERIYEGVKEKAPVSAATLAKANETL